MIDHISMRVSDLKKSLPLLRFALATIGYEVLREFPGVAGLGAGGKPDFWVWESTEKINPGHIAFAGTRRQVAAFHAAALIAGGVDDGVAGLRPEYHPDYYGAFIRDFDGNSIEVCCHAAPDSDQPTRANGPTTSLKAKPAKVKLAAPKAKTKKPAAKKPAAKKPAARKPTAKKPTAKKSAAKAKAKQKAQR